MPHELETVRQTIQRWLNRDVSGNLPLSTIGATINGVTRRFQIIQSLLVIDHEGRLVLFGFYPADSEERTCRFFWRSNSEGVWRAGTGLDRERTTRGGVTIPFSLRSHRYKKGQNEESGYIYETQIATELQNALSAIAAGCNPPNPLPELGHQEERHHILPVPAGPVATQPDYYRGYLGPIFENLANRNDIIGGTEEDRPGIMIRYAGAPARPAVNGQAAVAAIPGAVTYRNSGLIPNVLVNGKPAAETVTLSIVSFQQDRQLANAIKANPAIWSLLVPCLKGEPESTSTFRHALLNRDITVERYLLKIPAGANPDAAENIIIEIAEMAGEPITVHMPAGGGRAEANRLTTLCWVQNVYYRNAEFSTFGNYAQYPGDLSFLPQKAMDYYPLQVKQEVLRKGYTRLDATNTYASLVVFDEKYNFLIREYKKKKHLQHIYQTTLSDVLIDQRLGASLLRHCRSEAPVHLEFIPLWWAARKHLLAAAEAARNALAGKWWNPLDYRRATDFAASLGAMDQPGFRTIENLFRDVFVRDHRAAGPQREQGYTVLGVACSPPSERRSLFFCICQELAAMLHGGKILLPRFSRVEAQNKQALSQYTFVRLLIKIDEIISYKLPLPAEPLSPRDCESLLAELRRPPAA